MAFDTLDNQPYCVSAGLSITGGGLTATGGVNFTGANQCLATPFEGKNAGKWCVEIHCVNAGNDDCFGVTTAAAICRAGGNGYGMIGTTGGGGFTGQFGLGYRADGDINGNRLYLIGSNPLAHWGSWGTGAYLYLAIDLNNGFVWWRVNNGAWVGLTNTGNPATTTGGIPLNTASLLDPGKGYRIFPAVSMSAGGQYTFNFGATSFTYPAPTGFTAGWTNTGQVYFGSFLSNGLGGFTGSPVMVVSPYVCGFTGTISQLVGVGNSSGDTQVVGAIYDSDGVSGVPKTLLAKSGVLLGGTEYVYPLGINLPVVSGHTYYLGGYFNATGPYSGTTLAGGVANGLYIDSTAVWPNPNPVFVVSSVAANHIPMIANGVAGPPPPVEAQRSQSHIY